MSIISARFWRNWTQRIRNHDSNKTGKLTWQRELTTAAFQFLPEDRTRFTTVGYRQRDFFPHRFHILPKCGPDGYYLAQEMTGVRASQKMFEIVLYAESPVVDEFPRELFFDDDLVWHQQQFGLTGQIATVNIVVHNNAVFTSAHLSDLVQRAARRQLYRTRIQKQFIGWHHMLINAVMCFAQMNRIRRVYVPTSSLAMQHTDKKRHVQSEMFERVYDRAVNHHFHAQKKGRWWRVDLTENRGRVIVPRAVSERRHHDKTICITHDIERGFGHLETHPKFAATIEQTAMDNFMRILEIERDQDLRGTYNVVGRIMDEYRPQIEADGHEVAFHSYDHDLRKEQLLRCRQVDYRLKGYRAPQSKITGEMRPERLLSRNFEWFASSASSLNSALPHLSKHLIQIPILLDDFPLFTGEMDYPTWEEQTLLQIENRDFIAIGLHDCYAHLWLEHFPTFLQKIKALGTTRTVGEVANNLYLAYAQAGED